MRPGSALVQVREPAPGGGGDARPGRGPARGDRPRGAQVRGGAVQGAGGDRGARGARLAGGLERGPARDAELRAGCARRPLGLRERPPRGSRRPLPDDPGQESQSPRAGVDRAGSGSRPEALLRAGPGDQQRRSQGALRHRRRGAGGSLLVAQGFARLEYLVLQSSNESAITAQAQVLLPAAVHVEDEGTFTNLDGITQRFRRLPAAGGREAPLGVGRGPGPGVRLSLAACQRPGRVPRVGAASGRARQLRLGWSRAAGEDRPGAQPPSHRRRRTAAGVP